MLSDLTSVQITRIQRQLEKDLHAELEACRPYKVHAREKERVDECVAAMWEAYRELRAATDAYLEWKHDCGDVRGEWEQGYRLLSALHDARARMMREFIWPNRKVL